MSPYGLGAARSPSLLRLDGNEGPADPRAVELAAAACSQETLQRYPDAEPLRRALASRFGLAPAQVVLGNGADELLDRVCRAYLWPGTELLLPVPAFVMLPRYAALAGAALREVPWLQGPLPLPALLQGVSARTAVIAITSPNNPTGAVCTARDLQQLAAAAPGALLLCDFAYAEFADEDLTGAALQLPNAIVLRTFSKAYGLAGLRVGWAMGAAALLQPLQVFAPYPVAGPSLQLAAAMLQRGVDAAAMQRLQSQRQRLTTVLQHLGAAPLPSQANFVTARFADAAAVQAALLAAGIAVRGFAGDAWLGEALRITCPGDEAAFARLLAALPAAVAAGGRS